MKIFTNSQLHELDRYTIENEPISSLNLMERAAVAMTKEIVCRWAPSTPVVVFAGPGNNGGDALAIARMLAEKSYKVSAYLFNTKDKLSDECFANKERITKTGCLSNFHEISIDFEPPVLSADILVIDGLFGSGLKNPLVGGFSSLVNYINHSPAQVVSIDLPSGLMSEDNSYNVWNNVIKADLTLTIQTLKLAMLLPDAQQCLGEVKILDIGLSKEYISKTNTKYNIVEDVRLRTCLKERDDFAHKGTMGTALLVSGSCGMAGATVLATRACQRAGVGKVIVHTPSCNVPIVQLSIPEAVVAVPDNGDRTITQAIDTEGCSAMGIGPGLGTSEETAIAIITQIRRCNCPVVMDADAINILSNHKAWIQQLPRNIIMTPHVKEFDRLFDEPCQSSYERLQRAIKMAQQQGFFIILKGHNTAICMPDGTVYFNSTGNSGMATAGSGDVLTGIITGLLARGYSSNVACLLGVYLHGLAGDIAAERLGKECMIASDIIAAMPQAFKQLSQKV